jgi:hypothetical protein
VCVHSHEVIIAGTSAEVTPRDDFVMRVADGFDCSARYARSARIAPRQPLSRSAGLGVVRSAIRRERSEP